MGPRPRKWVIEAESRERKRKKEGVDETEEGEEMEAKKNKGNRHLEDWGTNRDAGGEKEEK